MLMAVSALEGWLRTIKESVETAFISTKTAKSAKQQRRGMGLGSSALNALRILRRF